jgi:HAD superfamily hydrolase (TIGR01509 family)
MEPRDLPVGVAGPTAQAQQVEQKLEAQDGAFDVHRYANEADARDAIADRDIYGAVAVTATGAKVLTATAASPTVAQMITNAAHERALTRDGVEAFQGSVEWVLYLRRSGVRTAVVSSSANASDVLRAAGIAGLFDLTVDGRDVATLGLRGKPAPDGFLEAARRLGVAPERAVVVEDALAGVAAGRDGDFGLVIGVARSAAHEDLRSAGADLVVDDLGELLP